MQPSSLIFVAIVAIWAAFLIQHWVRRREALATARSVDRFSEAIRLLERRPVLPSPEPRPAPAVYAALPSPLVARSTGARAAGLPVGRADGSDRSTRSALPTGSPGPVAGLGSAGLGSAGLGSASPRRSPRVKRSRWSRLGRRVRGIAFLGLAVLVPVTVVLSAAGVLRWTSVVVAFASLALGMVMLRYAAVHERTLARVERSMSGSERPVTAAPARRRPAPVRGATTATRSRSADHETAVDAPASARVTAAESAATAVASAGATAPVASVEPAAAPVSAASDAPGQRASRRAAYAAYGGDGTWQPVAVPPPTYTLKARAEHPQPQPAEVTPTPEPTPREPAVAEAPARAVGD